jgi:hypothetical protein
MDCNFPELLAGDLNRSQGVFSARQLTARSPSPSLTIGHSTRTLSLQDGLRRNAQSENRSRSVRPRSLQALALGERPSQFVVDRMKGTEHGSIESSSGKSDFSGVRRLKSMSTIRNASISTAATSLASKRRSANSTPDSRSPRSDTSKAGSWIDLRHDHNEVEEEELEEHSYASSPPPIARSRRNSTDSMRVSMKGLRIHKMDASATHRLGGFWGSDTKACHCQEPPHTTVPEIPVRDSSLNHDEPTWISPLRRNPPLHGPSSPFQRSLESFAIVQQNQQRYSRGAESPNLAKMDSNHDESLIGGQLETASRPPSIQSRRPHSELSTSMRNVYRWFESTTEDPAHMAQKMPSSTGTLPGVPLPAETLETLRVSISCFPDTMLLCSSLSIETIRSHARRVLHYEPGLTLAEAPSSRSAWGRLTGRHPPAQSAKLPESPEPPASPWSQRSTDWQALKNIFPSGTDYLCDALYAHILVYNYFTTLLPTSSILNTVSRPPTAVAAEDEGEEEEMAPSLRRHSSTSTKIPSKAAQLLGLHSDAQSGRIQPTPCSPTAKQGLRRKASLLLAKNRLDRLKPTSFSPAGRSTDSYERSIKDLRVGLATCIARLVATLRLSSQTTAAASSDEDGAKSMELDPALMRALCEIVRCCEGR